MMAVNCKFIIFFVLTHIYLIKTQDRRDLFHPDFKHSYLRQSYGNIFYSTPSTTSINEHQPIYNHVQSIQPTTNPRTNNEPFNNKSPLQQTNVISPDIIFRFSNVGLKKIGSDFIISDDIITLSLDENEISHISPFAFRKIKNMRHLNLSGNRIPTDKLLSLYGNIKLQTLIINNNNNSERTLKEYEILQSLEHLHLCNNNMSNIQVPFHLATPSLISLHLSNNSIKNDDIFYNLPATLTQLHLDRNSLQHVVENKLKNLQELIMDHNLITQICSDTCNSQSLSLKGASEIRILHLSKNLITEITSDAFNDAKYLSQLDLSNNEISEIPIGIFNNTSMMTKLNLANNVLNAVPEMCSMLHLAHLNLSGNKINGIFSDTFCLMRHLEYIDLSNNVITSIHTRAFTQLPLLKYLDLSKNQLRQLPARWISPWHIQELHLEENKFTDLNDVSLIDIKSNDLNVYLEGNPMIMFKAAYFHSLSGHLKVHIKNVQIEDKCASCVCENDEEERDEDNDNGDNDDNGDNGSLSIFG